MAVWGFAMGCGAMVLDFWTDVEWDGVVFGGEAVERKVEGG
jgi:hypothetical protein